MPEGFIRNWTDLFIYHSNPRASNYGDTISEKLRFKRKIGKGGEGFWLSPVHNSLYNYRLALKLRDPEAQQRYIREYSEITGKTGAALKKDMRRQVKNLFPLSGLTLIEAQVFKSQLDEEGRRKLYGAIIYWVEIIAGPDFDKERKDVLSGFGVDFNNGGAQ